MFNVSNFFAEMELFFKRTERTLKDAQAEGFELVGRSNLTVQVVGSNVEITGDLKELKVNGRMVRFIKKQQEGPCTT